MSDGNTYAINKHLDDQEDYDALQEVTAELEQAEARIEELEATLQQERSAKWEVLESPFKLRVQELEANLAGAVKLIDLAVELTKWDLNPKLRDDMIDFTTELKGQDDE